MATVTNQQGLDQHDFTLFKSAKLICRRKNQTTTAVTLFKDDTLEGGSDDDASGENRNWSRLVCHFSVKDFTKCESLTRSGEHVKEEDCANSQSATTKCKVQCLLVWQFHFGSL